MEPNTAKKKVPNPADVHVGARIRMRRMIVGISQEKLGQALGVTFQQVQKYEKGATRVGAGRLLEIANYLGVPIGYFFESAAYDALKASEPSGTVVTAPDEFDEFVKSSEGIKLNNAFLGINDPMVRRHLLDLVVSMSRTGQES
ncbi:helix-turn-helix domain-containing protein [Pleomorphomonas sp. NRK KF1]|uniref:helix-turn-helix domain-containing protein n=1 Tax=Pleomorphomonas sp. NRK KF1 TaxID=2943000 RepID=UPI002043A1FF|nr:helix-turn-helix transcriptional regulator [Pleomorphomonas sp. NRK KF1]MCM5552792.1 helix-turn-helix transcriptional regulator [Pleomorphomonas sp. NRK KF1]